MSFFSFDRFGLKRIGSSDSIWIAHLDCFLNGAETVVDNQLSRDYPGKCGQLLMGYWTNA